MSRPNFSTFGSFGDTIYSLCVMKMLGGGNLYVKLNYMDTFARSLGWADAGAQTGRYTQKDFDILKPLLDHQTYLDEIKVWNNEPTDYDTLYDHWKFHLIKGWQGNQTECYALTQNWDIHDPNIKSKLLYEPWLTSVDPIKIPNKPFVVNRTNRYLYGNPSEKWNEWVNNGLDEFGIFVGSPSEHKDFVETFNCDIEYCPTKDLLELAQVIQGSEMFIGNQSVALSIAIGLGKTYWCEIRKDYMNTKTPHGGFGDTWFPRINGNYF